VIDRNNVRLQGFGDRAMVFAHGFGCDQNMWRFVVPEFEKDFRVVLFDHVGAGGSDLSAYDPRKYSTLSGYADDVVEIGNELSLKDAVFVGHSVSAMIGVLASLKAPGMFGRLVLVGRRRATSTTLAMWAGSARSRSRSSSSFSRTTTWVGPLRWRPPSWAIRRPELGEELTNSFCRTDPEIAKAFAR
jgi:sigma-B regulation protein RsbQ